MVRVCTGKTEAGWGLWTPPNTGKMGTAVPVWGAPIRSGQASHLRREGAWVLCAGAHLHVWRSVVTYSARVARCHGPQSLTTGREKPVSPVGELATRRAGPGEEERRGQRVRGEPGRGAGRAEQGRATEAGVWAGRGAAIQART